MSYSEIIFNKTEDYLKQSEKSTSLNQHLRFASEYIPFIDNMCLSFNYLSKQRHVQIY